MKPTGIGTRQDHTPGTFDIYASYFDSAQAIADALTLTTDNQWRYIEACDNHIGGMGDTPAVTDGNESKLIWRDARGGWWIQKAIRLTWLVPDFDATLELARLANESESCVPDFTFDDVEEIPYESERAHERG